MGHIPRLLLEHDLSPGAEVALTEDQARHIGAVLRLDTGGELRVFNARFGEWRARVASKSKRSMSVRIEAHLRDAHAPPDLDLLFSPLKRHATDLIVEKATELGARRLRPILTQRTIAETVRLDRLHAIAREAAEQTERFEAPAIDEPQQLARALDAWDKARMLIFCDEEGDAPPMLAAAQKLAEAPRLAVLIGPEGGFAPEERRLLLGLPFVQPVSLGPRILRAETASISALTILQAAWGDWRGA